jgi:hypothetical protein
MPMTRTTVSIPVSLKARMDAHEPPINWSAIACRAFEAVVGVGDRLQDPEHDMTIIPPTDNCGTGVRLLDREDTNKLHRDLDAGRVVAIFDGVKGPNVAYALCTNAAEIVKVFATSDYSYAIKDE